MRIESLSVGIDEVPLDISSPRFHIASVWRVHVQLHTDTDIDGWGHAYLFDEAHARATEHLVAGMAPHLVGRDPTDPYGAEDDLERAYMNPIGTYGLVRFAYSAIDTAIWDCAARSVDQPLQRLLDGTTKALPVYTVGLWADLDVTSTLQAAEAALSGGLGGVKMHIDPTTPRLQIDRVRALTDLVASTSPDAAVIVDAAQGFSVKEALKFRDELAGFDVAWFEDPVHKSDYAGLAELTHDSPVPIASGESLFLVDEIERLLATGVRTALLDLGRIGGVTGFLRAADLCASYDAAVTSHALTHTSARLLACVANGWFVEYLDWFDDLQGPLAIADGHIEPPATPGAGGSLIPRPEVTAVNI